MRIIAGKYKGRKLLSCSDYSIRPTTGRIKEVIFNVLQNYLADKMVVDLFAGSGGLGLEALSRGARHVVFVEKSHKSLEVLMNNINKLGLKDSCFSIIKQDALQFAASYRQKVDLLLMDPPFRYPQLQKLIDRLFAAPILDRQSLLVVEHEKINPIKDQTDDYEIIIQKKHGRSLVSFLTRKENE